MKWIIVLVVAAAVVIGLAIYEVANQGPESVDDD